MCSVNTMVDHIGDSDQVRLSREKVEVRILRLLVLDGASILPFPFKEEGGRVRVSEGLRIEFGDVVGSHAPGLGVACAASFRPERFPQLQPLRQQPL